MTAKSGFSRGTACSIDGGGGWNEEHFAVAPNIAAEADREQECQDVYAYLRRYGAGVAPRVHVNPIFNVE